MKYHAIDIFGDYIYGAIANCFRYTKKSTDGNIPILLAVSNKFAVKCYGVSNK